MLYKKRPKNFVADVRVAASIIECNGEILLLKRLEDADHPGKGTWAEPGGKIEIGETSIDAAIRETYEETGLKLKPEFVKFLFQKHYHFGGKNMTIDFYHHKLTSKTPIIIDTGEHSNHQWSTPKQCLKMNLVDGFDEILREIYTKDFTS